MVRTVLSLLFVSLISFIAGALPIPVWVTLPIIIGLMALFVATLIAVRRQFPLLNQIDALLLALQALPPSRELEEAIDRAKRIREEEDNTSPSLANARKLRTFVETSGHEASKRQLDNIITSLEDEERRKDGRSVIPFPVVLVVLCLAWAICGVSTFAGMWWFTHGRPSPSERILGTENANIGDQQEHNTTPSHSLGEFLGFTGTFGDTFGAANSLLSALAVAGAIYSILLQGRELALQRDEMSMTRRELARTADAQSRSDQALAAQARITAFHFLAEHQRHVRVASTDDIERSRARGREQAHAYSLEKALRTLGTQVSPDEQNTQGLVTELSMQCLRWRQEYDEEVSNYADPDHPVGPMHFILCKVAEAVARFTMLVAQNPFAGLCFVSADSLIESAVREIDMPLEIPPDGVRQVMLQRSDRAFRLIDRAIDAMRNPSGYDVDATVEYMKHGDQFLLDYRSPNAAEDE